jgi:hypothetical protein
LANISRGSAPPGCILMSVSENPQPTPMIN